MGTVFESISKLTVSDTVSFSRAVFGACLGIHVAQVLVVALHDLGAHGMIAGVALRVCVRDIVWILRNRRGNQRTMAFEKGNLM